MESALKPGSSSLQILAALAPLVKKLGPAADPSNLKRLPLASAAVWLFYAGARVVHVVLCARIDSSTVFSAIGTTFRLP